MRNKNESTTQKEKTLRASEWAMEHGLPREDFLWWDKNEKQINEERFKQIKKQIGR